VHPLCEIFNGLRYIVRTGYAVAHDAK